MDELGPEWQRHFDEIRKRRGECPPPEVLAQYHLGRLSEEEAAIIREHVRACGVCELMLLRLAGPVEVDGEDLVGADRSMGSRLGSSRLALAIAAGVGGIVLGFVAARTGFQAEAPAPAVTMARAVKALRLTDTVRSGSMIPSLQLGNDGSFLLRVAVPTPAGAPYRATIARSDGAVLAELPVGAADTTGEFPVLLDAGGFTPGLYVLSLEPVQGGDAPRYRLEFRIEK